MKRLALAATAFLVGSQLLAPPGASAASWSKRMANLQNTNDVGDDPVLSAADPTDLKLIATIPTRGQVNATPVVSDGLLFVGDGGATGGYFYVIDLASTVRLVELFTDATVSTPLIGNGVQSTALFATVTTSAGEERRVYFGANVKPKSFWCLNVERILADRDAIVQGGTPRDGNDYLCNGADWPILIAGLGNVETNTLDAPLPVYNASPIFVKAQSIRDATGTLSTRDVIFTPTIGADCSDGQLWAIDAYTAELLWIFDPVPNFQDTVDNPGTVGPGYGGMIWTVPAMSKDGQHLYVTTGDCVEQPQLGFQAESLIDLDPKDGRVQWYHQRRLTDVSDYDVGNSPIVVDVEGPDSCSHVITSDKDGCIYAFEQTGDIPQVGAAGWDPARPGQQRILWRQCFVPGSLGGGFNASGVSSHGRTVMAQAASVGGRVPGDVANAFAVDACDGTFRWFSGSIAAGSGEGAIASGMWFQPSGTTLQVMSAGPTKQLLATVDMTIFDPQLRTTAGGGGPAIVDGTIYVPVRSSNAQVPGGVAIVRPVGGSKASTPKPEPTEAFGGPYKVPIGTGVEPVVMPLDPYDPGSLPAPPVGEWPSMHQRIQ